MTAKVQITCRAVTKRSGEIVPLDYEKIHKVISWACEGYRDVSVSDVATNAHLQLYDKIDTTTIHDTLIKSAANLISEESPNYQYVAARLLLIYIRKEVFSSFEPYSLLVHLKRCTEDKKYSPLLLEAYSAEDLVQIDSFIDHNRDLTFTYAGLREMLETYLVKNRTTRELYESPQYSYIGICMTIFAKEDKQVRLVLIKELYDALSQFRVSLPTPIMANTRTPRGSSTSCTLIDVGDGIESIFSSAHAVGKYVTRGAGIGLNMGRLRAEGTPIKNGLGYSTGCIPFYKLMESSVNSCNQGAVRKGSASINFPFWHYEAQSLIPLKDSRGTQENRCRNVDYIIQLNSLFYERFKQGKEITLFCPSQVPDLYDAFFQDQAKFEELYNKYEKKRSLRKRVVGSKELLDLVCRVRSETGRLYIMNIDNCNDYGVFNCTNNADTVRMTNLCCEITLPVNPIQSIEDKEGLIALCTLGAINLGKIKQLSDMESLARILVRALDNLIENQIYPLPAAERFGRDYRALGIGVSGLAHYLAQSKLKYADAATLPLVHKTFEAFQYYLLKASNELAQERGICNAFSTTKYSKGILPIDKYKRSVDSICIEPLALDWEGLREQIKRSGLRHTTLSAQMPVEKSSIVGNSTNGIEAPRALVSIKNNKNSGNVSVVVPEIEKYKKYYQLVWGEDYSNIAYLNMVAVIQKFLDQAISADIYDNAEYYFKKFQGDRDLMEKDRYKNMVQEIFRAHKLGVKTLYYHTTNDFSSEKHEINTHLESSSQSDTQEDPCPGGACTL